MSSLPPRNVGIFSSKVVIGSETWFVLSSCKSRMQFYWCIFLFQWFRESISWRRFFIEQRCILSCSIDIFNLRAHPIYQGNLMREIVWLAQKSFKLFRTTRCGWRQRTQPLQRQLSKSALYIFLPICRCCWKCKLLWLAWQRGLPSVEQSCSFQLPHDRPLAFLLSASLSGKRYKNLTHRESR